MRRIPGLSAKSLITFAQEAVEPGSVVHSDAWLGNVPVESKRYIHEVTFLRGNPKSPSDLPPRVHRVVSLLKRWLRARTKAPSATSTFTTTWMSSRSGPTGASASRGKLFYRFLQQGLAVHPPAIRVAGRGGTSEAQPQYVGVT